MVGLTLEESSALTEPLPSTLFLMADLKTAFPPHSVVPVAPLLILSLTSVQGYPVTGYEKLRLPHPLGLCFCFYLRYQKERKRVKKYTGSTLASWARIVCSFR